MSSENNGHPMATVATVALTLSNRASRMAKLLSMAAPPPLIHQEMRLIGEALESLRERVGEGEGENCTVCNEGFYSNDHCTYCGHEQYQ